MLLAARGAGVGLIAAAAARAQRRRRSADIGSSQSAGTACMAMPRSRHSSAARAAAGRPGTSAFSTRFGVELVGIRVVEVVVLGTVDLGVQGGVIGGGFDLVGGEDGEDAVERLGDTPLALLDGGRKFGEVFRDDDGAADDDAEGRVVADDLMDIQGGRSASRSIWLRRRHGEASSPHPR